MTENEVFEHIGDLAGDYKCFDEKISHQENLILCNLIEEVQQYRAIGTIEEFKALKEKKNFLPIATITFSKEQLQEIVAEKVAQIELDIQEIRAKAIDEFADRLSKYLNVESATKYGNKDAEQQRNSYDTLMKYEIADAIDDIAEQMKAGGENEND